MLKTYTNLDYGVNNGNLVRCPECGSLMYVPEDCCVCPECGAEEIVIMVSDVPFRELEEENEVEYCESEQPIQHIPIVKGC